MLIWIIGWLIVCGAIIRDMSRGANFGFSEAFDCFLVCIIILPLWPLYVGFLISEHLEKE